MRKILLLSALLFLFALPAWANVPQLVQSCEAARPNAWSSDLECWLAATTSGNWIIVKYSNWAATATWTSTETLTFTAGAQSSWTFSGFPRTAGIGYVQTTSNHSGGFQVKYHDSAANVNTLIVEEWAGLGSVDSGSATQATSTLSRTVTTAATNEIVFIECSDSSADLYAGSGLTQNNSIAITAPNASNANFRGVSGSAIVAAATTTTFTCSTATSNSAQQISALAFTQSSPPATPSINILQGCGWNFNNGGTSSGGCTLPNVTAGNTILAAYTAYGTSATLGLTGTETFTCVSGTQIHHVYSADDSQIICFVRLTSSHATFTSDASLGVGPLPAELAMVEIPGSALASTADSGSATGYAAQTGSYTTANNNEPTFMLSSDNNGIATVPTTMAPGNSFLPIVGIIVYNSSVDAQQMLLSAKVTATASTSTASWTFTTSHAPLTSVLAFGPAPISFVGYPVIY